MTDVGWIAVAVVVTLVLGGWVTFTATRLDRLHVRVDAAYAALDAALVRRSAAVLHVADALPALDADLVDRVSMSAQAALVAGQHDRERIENALSRSVSELGELRWRPTDGSEPDVFDTDLRDIAESSQRVLMARRFYNDAVRDTRSLRAQRMPRLLRLAGHRELPDFFDIDDSVKIAVHYPAPATAPDTARTVAKGT